MLHAVGMLSGSVYFDVDSDGSRDPSEIGVPGIVVRLVDSNSTDSSMERSTITDDDGAYTFDELEPGTYEISKRQSPALNDNESPSSSSGAVAVDLLSDVTLTDDQELDGNDFTERTLRPNFINVAWFFASSPPGTQMLREMIAVGEELAGDAALAASIRAGGTEVPDDVDNTPIAVDDAFSIEVNETLTVNAESGVLSNDLDIDGDSLSASLVSQPANGVVTLESDGSFSYLPVADFVGDDSFTYTVSDGANTSSEGTVRITVTPFETNNQPFGSVTPGSFEDTDLLGIRTDLVAGAPPITANHVDGDIDYTGYSNPPTYGNHHGFDSSGTDSNPGVTPRPSGVYTSEEPDEDLLHNLEHGHVWISYNPNLISASDRAALEQLVRDGSADPNGGGAGVILTPRSENDTAIALASWARLLTLDTYEPSTVRDFVETNRGKAPEGFITP
jgi:hypothetical protein